MTPLPPPPKKKNNIKMVKWWWVILDDSFVLLPHLFPVFETILSEEGDYRRKEER